MYYICDQHSQSYKRGGLSQGWSLKRGTTVVRFHICIVLFIKNWTTNSGQTGSQLTDIQMYTVRTIGNNKYVIKLHNDIGSLKIVLRARITYFRNIK